MGVVVFARAKLNLALDVLGKREDGFHDLRMVMQSAKLCDELRIDLRRDGGFRVRTNRSYIPCDDRNIAVKAARAFFAAAGLEGLGADIAITKRIPVCAGLGGGSSDAAAVLRGLNELTGAGLSAEALRDAGFAVGSDVPFCVEGGTNLAEGRGERLTPLHPLPELPCVICMPWFSISTPELFGRIDARSSRCRPDTEGMVRALETSDVPGIARRMYNVFEDVLDRRAGAIREIKNGLLASGALGAAMSGTGSAVFGLFADEETAAAAAEGLRPVCREVFLTSTCGAYPTD